MIAFKTSCRSPGRPTPVVQPLVKLLRELAEAVEAFDDAQYVQKSVGGVSNSVGAHVRHSLDHIEALLDGARSGLVDYEHRKRDLDVANDRQAARALIGRLEHQLLASADFRSDLQLRVVLDSTGLAARVATSFERELAFVLSHTIHHNSLIAVVAAALGVLLPEYFGYAPATIARLEKKRCAR